MIARCPQCQTRFRVAPEKVGPQGVRLRCSRCETVFHVPASSSAPAGDRVRALVAESDADTAKRVVEFLSRWDIAAETVQDGGAALLAIHRKRPELAILGGHLAGVAAPAVAEIVRRTPALNTVRLIRVAPIDEPAGAPEFDAEHTLGPRELPDGLEPLLLELGLGQRPAPMAAPPPKAETAARPQPQPTQPTQPAAADSGLAAAERLTRIIVSDIILYDDARFARAAEQGNVLEAFESELAEANTLFQQRVSETIRAQRDFLADELQARAEKRQLQDVG